MEEKNSRGIFNEMLPDLLQKMAPLIFIYALFEALRISGYSGDISTRLRDDDVGVGAFFALAFYVTGKFLEIKRSREVI